MLLFAASRFSSKLDYKNDRSRRTIPLYRETRIRQSSDILNEAL